jgi:hypothetical protein
MHARPELQALLAACALFAGCTATPYVQEERAETTGLDAGDGVGFLLSSYAREHGKGTTPEQLPIDRTEAERGIDACLPREMREVRGDLRTFPARAMRESLFPGHGAGRIDLAPQALLEHIAAVGHDGIPPLRYVVVLEGSEWTSGAEVEAAGQGQGGFIAVRWQYALNLKATVLDLPRRQIAGSLRARAKGTRGAGLGIIVVVPLPIVVYTTPEAARLCRALGAALVRFLAG